MTTPISRTAETGDLLSLIVGRPVSRAHGLRAANDISFLLSMAGAQPIISQRCRTSTSVASPVVFPVQYCRSKGIKAVLIEFRLYGSGNAPRGTVSVAASSGSIAWLAQNGVDGSTTLYGIDATRLSVVEFRNRAVMDVTGLTEGSIVTLSFTITSTSNIYGFWDIQLTEIPWSASDPVGSPTTETGIDVAWPAPSNRVVQGTTSIGYGIKRWVDQLLIAKTQMHRHIQVGTHNDTNVLWSVTGTPGNPFGSTFKVRGRRIKSTSTTNAYTLSVLYKTSAATAGTLAVSDGTNTGTATLSASTTMAVATASFNLKLSGSGQEADLTFTLTRTSGAGSVYLINAALIENET